jgi:hypothetical protein
LLCIDRFATLVLNVMRTDKSAIVRTHEAKVLHAFKQACGIPTNMLLADAMDVDATQIRRWLGESKHAKPELGLNLQSVLFVRAWLRSPSLPELLRKNEFVAQGAKSVLADDEAIRRAALVADRDIAIAWAERTKTPILWGPLADAAFDVEFEYGRERAAELADDLRALAGSRFRGLRGDRVREPDVVYDAIVDAGVQTRDAGKPRKRKRSG